MTLSSVRSLSLSPDQLVRFIRRIRTKLVESVGSSLSWTFLTRSNGFEEGTTRVVTGWPRRPRVEEKSDPDAQFPLSRWPSPPLPIEVCPTNELTSAVHQIDRSGNGCALCKRDGNEMICLLLLNLILYYACMYMYGAIEGSKDDNLSIGIFCSYLSGLVRGAI